MIVASLENKSYSTLVLDSWPVLELLRRHEPARTKFKRILLVAADQGVNLKISRINYGEIYYKAVHYFGEHLAGSSRDDLFPRITVITVDDALVDEAPILKSRFPISYADCFAAALAIRHDAPVVTGDPDFLRLESAGLLSLLWLGA